ncbi:MAG: TIGR02466 family protein [Paracoccaceae bacterium]
MTDAPQATQSEGVPQGPPQGQIQIRNLFPTPVATFLLPDRERINAALEARIFARETETPSVQHSNLGGWQSPTDFEDWCGPEGQAILDTARQIATRLTADRAGKPVQSLKWRINAWANVNRRGQGNEFHYHPGAFWSATYYVRDGGIATNPELGGEFEMQDPRGIGPAMLAPDLAFGIQGGLSVGVSETLRPIPGLLVVFPSWLAHAVRPYTGDDVRISIALNFTPI